MAVGKGSMEEAAVKSKTARSAAAAETVEAPDKAVLNQIVYQTSSGMLSRDAEPNERFGLGDAMPVYYF